MLLFITGFKHYYAQVAVISIRYLYDKVLFVGGTDIWVEGIPLGW